MNEAGVWAYVKKGMVGSGWHCSRIESSAGNGVPDVSFGLPGINGWIEFKYIKEWPKRPTTKVKLPLRPEQKHWIKVRGELSGNVWIFIKIEEVFFLIPSEKTKQLTEDGATMQEWFESVHWVKRVNFQELYQILGSGNDRLYIRN